MISPGGLTMRRASSRDLPAILHIETQSFAHPWPACALADELAKLEWSSTWLGDMKTGDTANKLGCVSSRLGSALISPSFLSIVARRSDSSTLMQWHHLLRESPKAMPLVTASDMSLLNLPRRQHLR